MSQVKNSNQGADQEHAAGAAAPPRAEPRPLAGAAPASPAAAPAVEGPRRRRQHILEGVATVGAPLIPRASWHAGISAAALLLADEAVGHYFDVLPNTVPEAAAEFYHDPLLADERGVYQVNYGCKGVHAEFASTRRQVLMHRPALAALLSNVASGAARRFYIDGWTGSGKSVALFSLVQWARSAGWVVMYVPSATLMVQGGRFYRTEDEEGGAPVWDTPEAARHVINGVLASHAEQLPLYMAADGSGRTLGEVAAAGTDTAAEPTAVVLAAIALKDGLLAAQAAAPGAELPRTLVVVDDYNVLYNRTAYHEPIHAFYRRPIGPEELRLAAAFRVLERPSAGDSGGVVVVAPTFGADVSPALRIPRPAGTKTLRVPRYDVNEVAAVARLLAASGLIEEQPSSPVLRRALALTNGNGKELREVSSVLLHEDSTLGPSLGYKALALARKQYNLAM